MAKNENKRDVCSSFILKKGVLILSFTLASILSCFASGAQKVR
jgi:hypothetical protein